jgi:hypothetical protein
MGECLRAGPTFLYARGLVILSSLFSRLLIPSRALE